MDSKKKENPSDEDHPAVAGEKKTIPTLPRDRRVGFSFLVFISTHPMPDRIIPTVRRGKTKEKKARRAVSMNFFSSFL